MSLIRNAMGETTTSSFGTKGQLMKDSKQSAARAWCHKKWPWVHCRAPYKENFGIQNLPPLKPGFYRIVIVIDGRKCNVMNSDRNVQHRYNYRLMQAGMQPLADHLKLCDNIDRFTAQTHCKNVFVNTMTKKMCAVARRVRPQGEDWTDTSFREHSEIHVGSVDPSQFLLAYYRPESIGQPIDKWNADNPLANNKKSKWLSANKNKIG